MSKKRWRFEVDDSGHHYLIPALETARFRDLLERLESEDTDAEVEFIERYDGMRINGGESGWTFTEPLEDG